MKSAKCSSLPEFLTKMIARAAREQDEGGFYRRKQGEGGKKEIWTHRPCDPRLSPAQKVKLPSLDMAKNIEDLPRAHQGAGVGQGSRRRVSLEDDFAHAFVIPRTAFLRLPTPSSKSIARCAGDSTGSWGRFEVWDAIGVEKSVARMKEEGVRGSGKRAEDAGFGRQVFLQKRRRPAVLFRLRFRKYLPLADRRA
jgi:3-hydroxyacyl-CoA dehydrogenase